MRYRDLETGTFLTRDPIGYGDGPNIYCYVHCNPITHFDAIGLAESDSNDSSMNGGQSATDTTSEAVDTLKNAAITAWNFVKGAATGYGEARSGEEAANPTTQAELNGRKFGRAAAQGIADTQIVAGSVGLIAGGGMKSGGTAATVGTGGTSTPVSVPVAVGGVAVEAISVVAITDGLAVRANASQLGPLRMTSSASENSGSGNESTSGAEGAKSIAKGVPKSKLGPSGKPKINTVKHPTQKAAKDAARAEAGSNGTTVKHPTPKKGNSHYHGQKQDGTKVRTHHEYPPKK